MMAGAVKDLLMDPGMKEVCGVTGRPQPSVVGNDPLGDAVGLTCLGDVSLDNRRAIPELSGQRAHSSRPTKTTFTPAPARARADSAPKLPEVPVTTTTRSRRSSSR